MDSPIATEQEMCDLLLHLGDTTWTSLDPRPSFVGLEGLVSEITGSDVIFHEHGHGLGIAMEQSGTPRADFRKVGSQSASQTRVKGTIRIATCFS